MNRLKVLVACEYSGRVRDAFLAKGHDAISCDLLPTEVDGPHYTGDISEVLGLGWDLMIAHPPCTHLAVSGSRWFKNKAKEQEDALKFVQMLMDAPIPMIALENPISVISSRIRKPDQIIQPWQFGHMESKATCLWLKNLPKLQPSNAVSANVIHTMKSTKSFHRIHRMPPSKNRWKERSRTYEGIAKAMADQWGGATEHGDLYATGRT